MNFRQGFLLLSALGLVPIALSYGAKPQESLAYLFDVSITNTNGAHIFRAIMGLYFATLSFWLLGAFKPKFTQPALYSLIIFMLGLAAGRILSFIVDGVPDALLLTYLGLELAIGLFGLKLLKSAQPA